MLARVSSQDLSVGEVGEAAMRGRAFLQGIGVNQTRVGCGERKDKEEEEERERR